MRIEIPARDQEFYGLRNVPHGQLREVFFTSTSTDTVRRAFVYTPPGYDQNLDQRYPVLYLQHGWGENEYGWGVQGRAAWIMDNLIAENRIRPEGIPTPRLPIDYHCIGDGEHMVLFFTGDDGNFYRSRTTYAEFPKGFILDPNKLMFLYQGIADADNRGDYGRLPYRLGLLRAVQGE